MHRSGICCTTVENLSVTIGRRTILSGVSFTLHCGELTVIIGPNGAGKTTLLRALLGEIPHTGGISFLGHDGAPRRLRIGYVPQRVERDPNAPASVFDLCASLLSRQPVFLFRDRGLRRHIQEQLAVFGADGLVDARLCDLSGGEWQRVMLAIATDPVPELLVLDEPASGIDRNGLSLFYEKLKELKTQQDLSILLVSHDFQSLHAQADRLLLLDGTVRAQGTPAEVLASDAYRALFGGGGAA